MKGRRTLVETLFFVPEVRVEADIDTGPRMCISSVTDAAWEAVV